MFHIYVALIKERYTFLSECCSLWIHYVYLWIVIYVMILNILLHLRFQPINSWCVAPLKKLLKLKNRTTKSWVVTNASGQCKCLITVLNALCFWKPWPWLRSTHIAILWAFCVDITHLMLRLRLHQRTLNPPRAMWRTQRVDPPLRKPPPDYRRPLCSLPGPTSAHIKET